MLIHRKRSSADSVANTLTSVGSDGPLLEYALNSIAKSCWSPIRIEAPSVRGIDPAPRSPKALADISVAPLKKGNCRVSFKLSYQSRPALLSHTLRCLHLSVLHGSEPSQSFHKGPPIAASA